VRRLRWRLREGRPCSGRASIPDLCRRLRPVCLGPREIPGAAPASPGYPLQRLRLMLRQVRLSRGRSGQADPRTGCPGGIVTLSGEKPTSISLPDACSCGTFPFNDPSGARAGVTASPPPSLSAFRGEGNCAVQERVRGLNGRTRECGQEPALIRSR